MATTIRSKGVANNRNLVSNAAQMRSKANEEIFGGSVSLEVTKAKNAILDFADFNPKLIKDLNDIITELESCTKSGQPAIIMARVRHRYL